MSEAVIAHLATERDAILGRLKGLIRIPSISTDPAYAADMQRARDMLLAPNEFFRLSSLDEGLRTWPMLLMELGTLDAAAFAPFRHHPARTAETA